MNLKVLFIKQIFLFSCFLLNNSYSILFFVKCIDVHDTSKFTIKSCCKKNKRIFIVAVIFVFEMYFSNSLLSQGQIFTSTTKNLKYKEYPLKFEQDDKVIQNLYGSFGPYSKFDPTKEILTVS